MGQLHLAQVNIARMRGPLEALADRSPGFVWRLQTAEGNSTYLRPHDDDRILINLSVWESIEHLRAYTAFAFTFKVSFPPDPAVVQATDWSAFEPCPPV